MKTAYKLTPAIHKQIEALAEQLLPLQKTGKNGLPLSRATTKLVLGSELTPDIELDGPVILNKLYVVRGIEPILVNHPVNMIEEFKAGGMEGVTNYCRQVNEIAQRIDMEE
jgi:hypothetical protein